MCLQADGAGMYTLQALWTQAREQLRGEVVKLSLVGAEQVLQREVDANAHNASLQQLATQL